MAGQSKSKTITVASGRKIAVDLRKQLVPLSWAVRAPSGVTLTVAASMANRPGTKYVSPATNASLTNKKVLFKEETPVAWIQLSASGGDGFLDVIGSGLSDEKVHDSVADAITALSVGSVALETGESELIPPHEVFNYPKGMVDFTVTSSAPLVAAADSHSEHGTVRIVAVSTGTATITITGTTPTGTTASNTISVTVN